MATATEIYGWFKDYLDRNEYSYKPDDENNTIKTGMSLDGKLNSTNILIVCNDDHALVNAYIKPDADEKSRASVMEYITRVNYNLKNGGFYLDLDDGEICFRLYLNCMDRTSLSDDLIGLMIATPCYLYEYYGDGLLAVMFGMKSPEEVLHEIMESEYDSCSCGCDH